MPTNQTPTPSELKRFQADPATFRARLRIPVAGGGRSFSECIADFQRRDFAALDPAFIALARGRKPEPISRLWIERTKGASKDTDLASLVLWLVAFAPRSLTIQVAAAKQDQADEMRKAALDILRLTPWLGTLIEVQAASIINHRTGSHCDIITADAAGSHGARPHLVILNELTHIANREFAETLLDNASKVPHGVVVVATNAGHVNTWQHEWQETAIASDRWYFAAYKQPAPWLDPAELAEAKRRNSPSRYARLWEGVWGSAESGAIRPDDLAAVVTLPGPIVEPERGWVYVGGLDLGLTRDASALVVLGVHVGHVERERVNQPEHHGTAMRAMAELGLIESKVASPETTRLVSRVPGTGRMRLARLKAWRPTGGSQVSIEAIEETILRLVERFRLDCLAFDPWQAMHLAERMRRYGVPTMQVDFSPPNLREMATTTLEAFSERQVELFHDDDLLQDLRALKAVEKSYGMRLESPRGTRGHGDTATALSIALLAARRAARTTQRINRPLLAAVY